MSYPRATSKRLHVKYIFPWTSKGANNIYGTDWPDHVILCRKTFQFSFPRECATLILIKPNGGRGKMVTVTQTTFQNAFPSMKTRELRLKVHWSLFLKARIIIASICSDYGLAPHRRQAIIWTEGGGPVYWRIYASLGVSELTRFPW